MLFYLGLLTHCTHKPDYPHWCSCDLWRNSSTKGFVKGGFHKAPKWGQPRVGGSCFYLLAQEEAKPFGDSQFSRKLEVEQLKSRIHPKTTGMLWQELWDFDVKKVKVTICPIAYDQSGNQTSPWGSILLLEKFTRDMPTSRVHKYMKYWSFSCKLLILRIILFLTL
jgi:hypothetical protein